MLCEEEAFADYRDYAMYNRIVSRMIRQHEHAIAHRPPATSRSLDSVYENGACISNIQRNRARDTNDCVSLYSEQKDKRRNANETTTQGGFLSPTFPNDQDDEDQVFTLDLWATKV